MKTVVDLIAVVKPNISTQAYVMLCMHIMRSRTDLQMLYLKTTTMDVERNGN
jgi:hypothetical protein